MDIGYKQSIKHGPQARQFVVLFDMAGFNVKQYTWRPGELMNKKKTASNVELTIDLLLNFFFLCSW